MSEGNIPPQPRSANDRDLPVAQPAEPEHSFGWKVWLVVRVLQARLRFIVIMAAIAAVIIFWPTLQAYWEKWMRSAEDQHAASSDTEYFCSMHPQFVTNNPKEKCPICHMDLTPRKKQGKPEPLGPGVVTRVQFSPYRMVLAGVQAMEVTYQPFAKEIVTVGTVEFDERLERQITADVKGRIDKLYVNYTGQEIHPDEPLASVYSPELAVAIDNLRNFPARDKELVREKLRRLRIGDDQIQEMERNGKPITHVTIRAPITGEHLWHVRRKYPVEGKWVDEGAALYDVAGLSNVWIEAQVYENDLAYLKEGMPVTATTSAVPNRVFEGKVAFLNPHLDGSSRTLKVRFDIPNPDHELRPGMYATVKLQVPAAQLAVFSRASREDWAHRLAADTAAHALFAPAGPLPGAGVESLFQTAIQFALLQRGQVLVVPESAVIDTGSLKIVYREFSPGVYDGVEVQLGPRTGIYYPVVRGLEAGDRVVTAGSFLVDAETRLNPAAGSIYFIGGDSALKGGPSAVTAARSSMAADQDAEVEATLAKLKPADRSLAKAQKFCPILQESRLGSMGKPVKVIIKDQPVFLCCKNCEKEAREHPDETLATVEKLKAKVKIASPMK